MTKRRAWGTGSVYEERGEYVARLPPSLRGDSDGRIGSWPTREEAEKRLNLALAVAAEGGVDGETLDGFATAWLERRTIKTAQQQRDNWARYIRPAPIAAMLLEAIAPNDVRRFLIELRGMNNDPIGASAHRACLSLIRTCLDAAAYQGKIPDNPAKGIQLPRDKAITPTKAGKERLDCTELDALLRKAEAKLKIEHRSILTVMATQGLRPSEMWRQRWEDVDLRKGWLIVSESKTEAGKRRRLRLLPPAWQALSEWRDAFDAGRMAWSPLVWPSRNGAMPHAEGYTAQYPKVGPKGTTVGCLRSTCGSMLLLGAWVERGWMKRSLTIVEVSRWLGHSSIDVTVDHYANLKDDELAATVENGPHKTHKVEPPTGFEPVTYCLRNGGGSGGLLDEAADRIPDVGHLVGRFREARHALAKTLDEEDNLWLVRRARALADVGAEVEDLLEALVVSDVEETA